MFKYHFHYTLTVFVYIEDKDFYFIFESAKNHYDRNVREMTKQGGFLFGWRNRRELFASDEDDRKDIEFTSRDLQLCSKAIEFPHGNDEVLQQAWKLKNMFCKIHEQLGIACQNQNKEVIIQQLN